MAELIHGMPKRLVNLHLIVSLPPIVGVVGGIPVHVPISSRAKYQSLNNGKLSASSACTSTDANRV